MQCEPQVQFSSEATKGGPRKVDGHSFVEISLEPNFAKCFLCPRGRVCRTRPKGESSLFSGRVWFNQDTRDNQDTQPLICRITSLVMLGTVCNSAPLSRGKAIASACITLAASDGEHCADEILIEQPRLAAAFVNRVGER